MVVVAGEGHGAYGAHELIIVAAHCGCWWAGEAVSLSTAFQGNLQRFRADDRDYLLLDASLHLRMAQCVNTSCSTRLHSSRDQDNM